MRHRNLFSVLAALLLTLCLLHPAAAQDAPRRQFLWEVKSKTATIYLLGAMGMGSRDMYPMPPSIESIYSGCDAVAIESDTSDEQAFAQATRDAYYKTPDSIKAHIAPDLYEQLHDYHDSAGLDWDVAQTMKPYILAFTLVNREVQKLGMEPMMDQPNYFTYRARSDKKPLIEMEGVGVELATLEAMPADLQEALLKGTFAGVRDEKWRGMLESEINAWRDGDLVKYEELDRASYQFMPQGDKIRDLMVYQRHPRIMSKLTEFLQGDKKVFVVLGAPHLVGGKGLVTALRSKGYEVRQL